MSQNGQNGSRNGKATVKAVVAHAEKLRAIAERQEKADPYLIGKV